MLRLLLERNGVSQSKLTPEVGFQASASLILLGKRQLNRGHIARLSRRFGVSPAVFFDQASAIPLRRKVRKSLARRTALKPAAVCTIRPIAPHEPSI